jgi:hypothetical protein
MDEWGSWRGSHRPRVVRSTPTPDQMLWRHPREVLTLAPFFDPVRPNQVSEPETEVAAAGDRTAAQTTPLLHGLCIGSRCKISLAPKIQDCHFVTIVVACIAAMF